MTEHTIPVPLPDQPLPPELLAVLRGRAICFLTTLMPDGSPQVTQTWVGTDGQHLLVNTVKTHQKTRNVARDPRVALGVADPTSPLRSWGVRGRVITTSEDGAREHLDALSQRYLGRPYPGFTGGSELRRIVLTIDVERLHTPS